MYYFKIKREPYTTYLFFKRETREEALKEFPDLEEV